MKKFTKITAILLTVTALCGMYMPSSAAEFRGESDARSLILMEAETGRVLYEKDADLTLPPASVTKVMSMLLIMEAIDSGVLKYEDMVSISENAASMGGSQVFLEPGEQMSVHELLKCVVVSSANDACVALAEHISGSEESFVARMNERAKELGMTHTTFENTNGLDDTTVNHMTSARDIAIMSAELITKHPKILEYSSIWMDSIRNGEFGLTNTNRLIRFYNGANGLKTGSTSRAKFCISASAKRDGMQLICVVMAAESRDSRNDIAKKLFDFGFANYAYENLPTTELEELPIIGGKTLTVPLSYEGYSYVTDKVNSGKTTVRVELPESIKAPISSGDTVGKVIYELNGEVIAEHPVTAAASVDRMEFFDVLRALFEEFLY